MSGSLTHSPADVIRHLLISLTQGTLPSSSGSWPVHVSQEPDDPDNCITCYDTLGTDDGRTAPDNERQEHHGTQIRIRAQGHVTGYTKARAIAVALDGVTGNSVTISSSTYHVQAIVRKDVNSLGKDVDGSKKKLDLFTINLTSTLRQTS